MQVPVLGAGATAMTQTIHVIGREYLYQYLVTRILCKPCVNVNFSSSTMKKVKTDEF